ncbi:hypothetical protein Scep_005953 [Stephania cephalantha]|uniref:Light-mediated development protein DET1 n=1 Tax=Stephania cephalantha TaxID=152367 RepID=A0AAP0K725_9MAGN
MFKSNNIVSRIFERQIYTPAPSTSVNCARQFYENLVPNCTIYNVDCPDHSFRKFTDDGRYLISFSKNYQDLIVYRPMWLSFSCNQEDCDSHDLPSKAKRFDHFFTQLYCMPLASNNEFICKDFFLYMESNQFGIFASQTAQVYDAPATGGAVRGVPSIEKITFHLVRLSDGVVLDEKVYCNDFVNLAHSMGVFLYDDLLAIMSLRYQTIHVLQIRESGYLVDVRAIGPYCREDDELFFYSHAQAKSKGFKLSRTKTEYINCEFRNTRHQDGVVKLGEGEVPKHMVMQGKSKQVEFPLVQGETGLQRYQSLETSFLSGMKQRLLSFIFRGLWNEERDRTLRVQCLKKKFHFHFQDYVDLIMWKVQFLDRYHLLIKFGSVDGGVSRNTDQQSAFLAVYNIEATEVIAFYQNSAEEIFQLFEQFCDHFHANSRNLSYMNFITSHSNNIHALEQLKSAQSKASSFSQFVKKTMAALPFCCQSQSPSPYFDQSLFRFDEKLISATDGHRQCTEHPIKFISRRHPNILKFKIKPGLEVGGADVQTKKISTFLFHPFLPLALSIQHTLLQPPVINIHFRR